MQGLGALSFHRAERGGGGHLYNAFNPLHFDPRGRQYKNNSGAEIMAVSSPSAHCWH